MMFLYQRTSLGPVSAKRVKKQMKTDPKIAF